MFRVYACLTQSHDLRLVALAVTICAFASITALMLFSHTSSAVRPPAQLAWLAGTAVVTGVGIWSTHFVAMLAFQPNMPVGYDLGLTVLSILLAVAVTGVGFVVTAAARPRRRWPAWPGGAIIGLGIFSMHYTGMAAMLVPGHVGYDTGLVAASLIIGVVAAAVALRWNGNSASLGARIGAGAVLTLAICGLHFTAMAAVVLTPDPTVDLPLAAMSNEFLATGVAGATLLIATAALIVAAVDQRCAARQQREADRLRATVAELEATRAKLEHTSDRLHSKSQFLATMSHELRTPMNAVIGFTDLLMTENFGGLNPRQRDYLGDIRRASDHLMELISDVLDMARLDAHAMVLDREEADLAQVAADALSLVRVRAQQAGVALALDCPFDTYVLPVDVRRVRQILLNLLSNAIKFTPGGGEVHVGAAHMPDGGIALSVRDSGVGIAAEEIPVALSLFGQVDSRLARKYDGTGLGLPLSKRLMELHGGTLTLRSEPGAGTCVTVTFPPRRILAMREEAA